MFKFKSKKPNLASIDQMVAERKKEKEAVSSEKPLISNGPAEHIPDREESDSKKGIKVKALSNSKYDNTDIGMLHNQFYTSSEKLLVESKDFMKTRSQDLDFWEKKEIDNEDKAVDLKSLGFTNAGQTVQYDQERKEKKLEIENARIDIENKTNLANAVNYFKITYPAYKFITLANIKVICKNYGLVFGENSLFTGFVPKTNLEDIKNFWAWKDKTDGVKKSDRCFKGSSNNSFGSNGTFIPYAKERDSLLWSQKHDAEREYPRNIYDGDNDWKEEIKTYFSEEEVLEHTEKRKSISHSTFIDRYVEKNNPESRLRFDKVFMDELYIAAPQEDMNMEGKTVVDFEIVDAKIEDPVIFYPVSHGGIVGGLIITAWGDEASDPLVHNEKLN